MADDVVRDYLGHPCRFTQAKGYFVEPLAAAHEKELREIKRNVGRLLLELSERLSHSKFASHAIAEQTSPIPDAENSHAMMEILAAYELETENRFWAFAGLVLAGLDRVEANGSSAAPVGGAA
jgi:hypothetical protein